MAIGRVLILPTTEEMTTRIGSFDYSTWVGVNPAQELNAANGFSAGLFSLVRISEGSGPALPYSKPTRGSIDVAINLV
jgi:hypothetical protein